MAIEPVHVEYSYSRLRNKHIQVSRLQQDGSLFLKEDPDVWIQSNSALLLSVQVLELKLDRRAEKIDSIGTLSHLTHLFISGENFMWLPNSISSLPNLQRLQLVSCSRLQELPANLGDLNNLTFLSLGKCSSIKSLPQSISKLSNLTSLHLSDCDSLKVFPANSNVVELILSQCKGIQTLPEGLCNLKQLDLVRCSSLTELPTDLNMLEILEIQLCCRIQSLPKGLANLEHLHLPLCSKLSFANLIYLRSLCHLTFDTDCECRAHLDELRAILGELSELLTLNIQSTTIKWLPWSITKLPKLRLLHLPQYFRLETLPKQLNDSIVISIAVTRIRKTWKQLKTEIELFGIPIVGVEAPHSPSTPGYLRYGADPGPCIHKCSLLRILDLDLQNHELDRNIIHSMGNLPELTHLYISDGYLHNLPLTLTRLAHLFLVDCKLEKSCRDSLGKLSTLESLTLYLCKGMPVHLDLPVSLTHFALEFCDFASIPGRYIPDSYTASMRKLSNMKTLNISGFKDLELLQLNMNLTKLRVRDCHIESLPRCVQHLEIIHSRGSGHHYGGCWDELQVCLSQVVNLATLSVTCDGIKVLPSIATHQTLQELQLKDCFNLRKLPSNLNEFVKLYTLNVSGTRIKSLPYSIIKLQNLRHVILPKCFIRKSLPKNIEDKVRFTIDDTDDMYYQHMHYYDSCYDSSEDNSITPESMEGGDEVVLQDSRHNSVIEQASAHSLLKPHPVATQVDEGFHFSSRTVPIDNAFSSSQNCDMEILLTRNEDCGVPLAPNSHYHEMDGHHFVSNMRQVNADPEEREDSPLNGLTDAVGESSSHALCNFQIEEMYCLGTFANDLAAKSSSNLHETNCFSESNQHYFQNGQMDTIYMDVEHRSAEYESTNSVHGGCDDHALDIGQNHNPQSDKVKENKTQKKEIQLECILPLMSQNMRLIDAAKQLDVSRSTLKRILKKNKTKWLSSRKRKQHQDAKSKKHNTKSPCVGKNSSLLNLVDPTNLAGHDHGVEHLNGPNQLTLTDQVPSVSMVRTVAEPPMATQCHKEGHLPVKEHSNDAKECTLLHTVQQPDESSSTFVVKATYNEDTTRFNFSLSSSIEQLKEEVGKRLELEVGKFKMKYQDDDKELVLMSTISDLEHALSLSTSSGSNVVRLSVFSKT